MFNFKLVLSVSIAVVLVAFAVLSIALPHPVNADNIGVVNTNLGPVRVVTSAGNITGLTAMSSDNLPCSAGGYIFPDGMFSYSITDLAPGQSVTVNIILPNSIPFGSKYFKCENTGLTDFTDHMTQIDTSSLSLALTDGMDGDADGQANGVIVDPGGPAFLFSNQQHSSGYLPSEASQQPVALPNIVVQSASLSSTSVAPGNPVTVTANVINRGDADGSSMINLYVNGAVDSGQGVSLQQGAKTQIIFTVNKSKSGTYTVYAGNVPAGSFTVDSLVNPNNIILFISAAAILTFIVGLFVYMKRARASRAYMANQDRDRYR